MDSKKSKHRAFLILFVFAFSYSQELDIEIVEPDTSLSLSADSLANQPIDSLLLDKYTIYGIAAYGLSLIHI